MKSLKLLLQFILAGVLAGVFCLNATAAGDTPLPVLPKATKGERCIAPIETVRRQHMVLLKHQREDTMRRGLRPEGRYSLKGCIDCHVQKDTGGNYIPVNGPGQFCHGCHDYAAVITLDCFSCHASKPADK